MLQSQQILQARYQLQLQLGQTGAGRQTWLAIDLESSAQEPVIVKLLAFNPQLQWEDVKLFERESQVLKNLDHPRIPRYRDYFALDEEAGAGLPWFALVQEHIPGQSLQNLLNEGKRFTETQAKYLAEDILNILIYLHELSPPVFHRDIKPSNLILSGDRQFYLVDFGAVQDRAKAEGASFTVVGTSGYAAPEQLWDRTVAASDLYALGATLIHLLTGISPENLPQRNLRIQFRDSVALSAAFTDWLERMVEPSLERRFESARQALNALRGEDGAAAIPAAAKPGVRYDLLAMLSIVGLFFGSISLAPLVLPSLLTSRRTASQEIEARTYVSAMNRAQQAHFIERQTFSRSMPDLQLGFPEETSSYGYFTRKVGKTALSYGIARKPGLKSYVGGVLVVPATVPNRVATSTPNSTLNSPRPVPSSAPPLPVKDGAVTVSILCESTTATMALVPEPVYSYGTLVCAKGTIDRSR